MDRRDLLKAGFFGAGASLLRWGGNVFAAPFVTEVERVARGRRPDMIITDIENFIVDMGTTEEETRAGKYGRFGVCRISTNSGITGYSFGSQYSPEQNRRVRELLTGRDPFAIEDFINEGICRVAGWEHALWDVCGKACGMPVFRLLGGPFRDRIKLYLTTVWHGKADQSHLSPEQQAEDLLYFKEHGFLGAKIRAQRPDIMDDVEALKAIKRACGADFSVMFDRTAEYAGWVWTYEQALEVARGMEEYGAYWLEEPFERGDIAKSARLREAVDLYITGGEGDNDIYMFAKYLDNGSFDIVQPDGIRGGGILVCRKIAMMAQAFQKQMIMHGTHGLRVAGWLQVDAASPVTPWQELVFARPYMLPQDAWEPGLKLLHNKDVFTIENGYILIPQGPGLGLDVNEDALEEFRVRG